LVPPDNEDTMPAAPVLEKRIGEVLMFRIVPL
jgi:hypothetical protein